MSRLNPFFVKVSDYGEELKILITPAVNHSHNWKANISGREFFWKTKASAVKNLKRIYGYAEEV